MKTIQFENAEFLPQVCELINEKEGNTVTIRAKGNSMRPFIESDRDSIVLGKVENIKVGDVVLAEISKGRFVLHRLDKVYPDHIRLRGDGNPYQTELCKMEDIRAKAVQIIRKGKAWNLTSKTWKVYSFFWVRLLPVRRYLLALYRLLWMGQLPGRFMK